MSEVIPTIPPVSDFQRSLIDEPHIELIRGLLKKHGPEVILDKGAEELKIMLFHRVKFYPDFMTTDGSKWFGLRFNHDGDDYLLLVQKGVPVSEADIGIYYDDSVELSEKEFRAIAKTMYSILHMADMELGS